MSSDSMQQALIIAVKALLSDNYNYEARIDILNMIEDLNRDENNIKLINSLKELMKGVESDDEEETGD